LYNHILDIDKTSPIDEKTFFKFVSKAKNEINNDCREVFMNFIENYEIFNRIYDEFNDEEVSDYQEQSCNKNELEEIQEEDEEEYEESEYNEGSSTNNELEEIQEEEEEEVRDRDGYFDLESEKRMDDLIKTKLIKKMEFLKDSIYKQKVSTLVLIFLIM